MGRIRVQVDDEFSEWPLSATELVGRNWRSSLRLGTQAVPQFWLELRWRNGHWCWRPLSAEEFTRGTGGVDASDWRRWSASGGVVRLDGTGAIVELRLIDAAPPQTLVEELPSGRRHAVHDANPVVEAWPDGRLWPLGADPSTQAPLRDGDTFTLRDRIYRILGGSDPAPTNEIGRSLTAADVSLSVDLETMQALLEGPGWSARVSGECVRVAAVYALARRSDGQCGGRGWVPTESAHAQWVELGGRAESPVARLGWERGKFRSQLALQGVCDLDVLFESRRHAGLAEVRLALVPDQVTVNMAE